MAEKAGVMENPEVLEKRIEDLRAEIQRTRSHMESTVSELQERLSPSHVKRELQSKVSDVTVGKVKRASGNFVDMVKENPVPSALAALGIGWLLISRRTKADGFAQSGSFIEDTSEEEGLSRKAAEYASRTGQKVSEYTDRASQKIDEVTGSVREKASQYMGAAREKTAQASDYFTETFSSNPLGFGLAAMALGMVFGLSIPSSEKEELFGEKIASKVGDVARETMDKVSSVAKETVEVSKQKAQEKGLIEKQGGF
jgi:ElaB/YqjD/DUF883 family membrane-anchored ribosome-binding protein